MAGSLLGPEAGARAAQQTPDEFDEVAEREEQSLLRDMMDDTEREIHSEAFGEEPPENDGDTTLEDEAGEDEIAGEPPEEEDDDELSPEGEVDDGEEEQIDAQPDRGDPRVALRAERARRQELERQLAEAQGFRQGVESVPRQQQEQQPPPPPPDMFADPEGWQQHVRTQAVREAIDQVHRARVDAAMLEAHQQHGDEFQVAYNLFTSQPRNQESARLAQRMINSPDPGAWLMRWAEPQLEQYRVERQQSEVERISAMFDGDPALMDAVISHLGGNRQPRERGAPRGRPQPPTQRNGRRGLPSLNSAGGSGSSRVGADPRGFDGSEQSIFDYAFQP